jgi:TM2 domain-containing membrane protein YozV
MDENNNDALDDAKDKIEEAAEKVEQETKSTAEEFKEGWNEATKSGENKKMMAGLLAIFLGGFGIHKFILGYNKEGIILLGILLVSFPLMCVVIGAFTMYIPIIIGLIEGIIYITKTDEEFYNTYQVGKKPWF